ncbi:hypothetical protein BJN34_35920 (plasmid) [Cupriavidus necator]|uniref:RiboL-PSP-HEPN domain-containing protein n=1 Tax=Cupriavidus necator TaxID=106590 RepID=A0A1U9V2T4_CUPNE|nr:hypothetical protein [Cupriavidus necator]AQV99266.1 hypothetical protein BJN34_35920 [Cupriavidus necator]
MRKADPAGVRSDFQTFVAERLNHFGRIETVLSGAPHEKRDLSILAETTLHSVYVAFEVFLSDLMLAYINRNFSAYQGSLKHEIERVVKNKFGAGAAARTQFQVSRHIKLQELEELIDPTGFNLTFKSVAELKSRFADWVSAAHGAGVAALSNPDAKLIDTTRAIRNFIAHGSVNAKNVMNAMLANVSTGARCPNAPLARGHHKIDNIGAYLKSSANGQRRVVIYVQRLQAIAATL